METYTVIKRGESIQHCLKIPEQFINKELEITIKPVQPGERIRNKIENILDKYKNTKPFKSISDPIKWQRETRSDW